MSVISLSYILVHVIVNHLTHCLCLFLQLPPMVNYSMAGRTYRYFHGDPLYPFGYGLSYSAFLYSNLELPDTIQAGSDLEGEVSIINLGPFDADEVILFMIFNR